MNPSLTVLPRRKPRLLAVGDAVAPTGFSRVVRAILSGLPADQYEIYQLGINYHGDPHGEPWPIYPARLGGDAHGVGRLKELMDKLEPDLVFLVNDLWVQGQYLEQLQGYGRRAKLMAYAPVDAGPVDPEWLRGWESLSKLVLYTDFGRQEVLKAFGPASGPPLDVIPHGVDTTLFYPLGGSDRAESVMSCRKAKATLGLFPEKEIDDSFLVLNAHRNQPRKRIDLTLKAFALFAEGKPPGVQLYLHMGTEDLGWNVLKLANRYGIFDRVILTQNSNEIPGVSSEQLNLIYNACDVGLSTSAAEGWGLPNFEHAAAGKPQVIPRFGALEEIWDGCAELVEPSAEVVFEHVITEAKAVQPEDVATALERLYRDRAYRADIAWAGYRRVTRPENDWTDIARRWHELFQDALNGSTCDVPNRKSGLLLETLSHAPDGPVVEIGCIRQDGEDPADGFSTYWLARRCRETGRPFRSFDLDAKAVSKARAILQREGLPGSVECRDGADALSDNEAVAFLYLDGPDSPKATLDQLRSAELLPGAVLVVDDAQSYGIGTHGKATLLVQEFEKSPLPQVPFRILRTEPGYAALVATFPSGKCRGVLEPRDSFQETLS